MADMSITIPEIMDEREREGVFMSGWAEGGLTNVRIYLYANEGCTHNFIFM